VSKLTVTAGTASGTDGGPRAAGRSSAYRIDACGGGWQPGDNELPATGEPLMRRKFLITALAVTGFLPAVPVTASAGIPSGFHQIVNRQDFVCVDVVSGARHDGAEVRTENCLDTDHERWSLEGSLLRVAHTRKCLSVQWNRDPYGSNVVQDACDDATRWFTRDMGGGWTRIFTFAPDRGPAMCLDKAGWDVTVWGCHGAWWQQWQALG